MLAAQHRADRRRAEPGQVEAARHKDGDHLIVRTEHRVDGGGARGAPLLHVELRFLAAPAHGEQRERRHSRRLSGSRQRPHVALGVAHDHVAVAPRVERLAIPVGPNLGRVPNADCCARTISILRRGWRPVVEDDGDHPPVGHSKARLEAPRRVVEHREVALAVALQPIEHLHFGARGVRHHRIVVHFRQKFHVTTRGIHNT
eukprot:1139717-Prymnesium_polylepis.2